MSRRLSIALIALGVSPAWSQTVVAPGQDLRAAIAALQPGQELQLAGGTHTLSGNLRITKTGTVDQPIVVRAKPGETPIVRQPNASQNVIEIADSRYLEIRGIQFTGGSHGVRLMNSDDVTIADCEIYETGDVALSANSGGVYERLRLLRNHIHHTNGSGEGMYLGCHDNSCRVANSLIEGNYIHHTNRAAVTQGDGIELKEGSYGNVVRDNVIHDTKYPAIITYSVTGNGAANVLEGNVIWNVGDSAIQVAADATIRNNILLDGPISLQSHLNGSPSNIEVVHNTIVTNGHGIDVRNVSGDVLVANNAIYASGGAAIRLISGTLSLVRVAGNVGTGGISGGASGGIATARGLAEDFVGANASGTPPIDVYPRAGSPLIGSADTRFVPALDFDGLARSAADAGAYRYDGTGARGNWRIVAGFKSNAVRPKAPTNVTVR
jgi:hypothetical protein